MSKMKKMEEITFYRNKRGDKIWRVDRVDEIGRIEVSFDKKKSTISGQTTHPSFRQKKSRLLRKKCLTGLTFLRAEKKNKVGEMNILSLIA
ncbi:hypothetical protein LOB54_07960 [Lactobacillus delbrueckii subsp. bulgaricus]|uniref:DUF7675 family protein n=1 Tax=Lactobacillus delbrueckii TaxID=1584 RepID=UPI001BFFA05B|nr:hypothetical protein [Lactobacillus delbrueckii]MBU6049897.1 hypothetical protein [Lactobacillus delbrueckii]MCD5462554.1 hypothetical protein [Lactobacillus delbrueckii subsp. bulgaricus]MCD5478159.1 hypothetical protein [Lactobacillus delbrueckii subsp. bulgaricus]UUY35028.1 hypothetical protein NUU01_05680 [Lactobacillus delbrueckii subsp. bulgaricus]